MEYSKGDITAADEIRYAVNNERNAKAAENPIITMKGRVNSKLPNHSRKMYCEAGWLISVSYTHLTLPTNREV